jgi:hypothetical protein
MGTYVTAAVGSERSPGFEQIDSSMFKDFHIADRQMVGGLCRIGCCKRCYRCRRHYFVRHSQTEPSGASEVLIPCK